MLAVRRAYEGDAAAKSMRAIKVHRHDQTGGLAHLAVVLGEVA